MTPPPKKKAKKDRSAAASPAPRPARDPLSTPIRKRGTKRDREPTPPKKRKDMKGAPDEMEGVSPFKLTEPAVPASEPTATTGERTGPGSAASKLVGAVGSAPEPTAVAADSTVKSTGPAGALANPGPAPQPAGPVALAPKPSGPAAAAPEPAEPAPKPSESAPEPARAGPEPAGPVVSAPEPAPVAETSRLLAFPAPGAAQVQSGIVPASEGDETQRLLSLLDETGTLTKLGKPSDYMHFTATTNIFKVKLPQYTPRQLDEEHVKFLGKVEKESGTIPSASTIMVTVMDPGFLKDPKAALGPSKELKHDSVLCDGSHRTSLYKMQSEGGSHKVVTVTIVLRKDGKPLLPLDILTIGVTANEVASAVKKPTVPDNIHTAMSFCFLAANSIRVQASKMTPKAVEKVMEAQNVLSSVGASTRQSYIRIALSLIKKGLGSDEVANRKLALSHISNATLLTFDRVGFLTALDAVHDFVHNKTAKRGEFARISDSFFRHFQGLWSFTREQASEYNMTPQELLAVEIECGRKVMTYHQALCNSLASFTGFGVPKKERNFQSAKSGFLRSRLSHALKPAEPAPPAPTPKPPVSAEPRKSARITETGGVKKPQRLVDEITPALPVRKPRPRPRKAPVQKKKAEEAGKNIPDSSEFVGVDTDEHKDREKLAFKDKNLPDLPEGFSDPVPYEGPERPSWIRNVAHPAIYWPKGVKMNRSNLSLWLEALGLRKGHRAHSLLSPEYVISAHFMTFLHGALLRTKEEDGLEGKEAWWNAYKKCYRGFAYFGEAGAHLKTVGYFVFEGFADENDALYLTRGTVAKHHPFRRMEVFDGEGKPGTPSRDIVRGLFKYFLDTFPGEEALRDEKNREVWSPIYNAGARDEADRRKGIGRFTTTLQGIAHDPEKNNKVWVAQRRALLDVRIASILAYCDTTKTGFGLDAYYIPDTGGRFLYTGKGCPRQSLHTDFAAYRDNGSPDEATAANGFFALVTGKDASALHVVDYSHTYLKAYDSELPYLSKAVHAKLVTIPPFSVFIGRGDLFHAGPSEEDVRECKNGSLRYHLYFAPKGDSLPDAVHNVKDFRPPFEDEVEENQPKSDAGSSGGSDGDSGDE